MRLPWPFGRRTPSEEPSSAATEAGGSGVRPADAGRPASAGPSPSTPTRAWAALPPIQQTVGSAPLVAPSAPFLDEVSGHRPLPPILQPLGHDAGPSGPPGLVVAHPHPVPSLTSHAPLPTRPVQRRAAANADPSAWTDPGLDPASEAASSPSMSSSGAGRPGAGPPRRGGAARRDREPSDEAAHADDDAGAGGPSRHRPSCVRIGRDVVDAEHEHRDILAGPGSAARTASWRHRAAQPGRPRVDGRRGTRGGSPTGSRSADPGCADSPRSRRRPRSPSACRCAPPSDRTPPRLRQAMHALPRSQDRRVRPARMPRPARPAHRACPCCRWPAGPRTEHRVPPLPRPRRLRPPRRRPAERPTATTAPTASPSARGRVWPDHAPDHGPPSDPPQHRRPARRRRRGGRRSRRPALVRRGNGGSRRRSLGCRRRAPGDDRLAIRDRHRGRPHGAALAARSVPCPRRRCPVRR